jgi:iron complex outermembrane receptor protein
MTMTISKSTLRTVLLASTIIAVSATAALAQDASEVSEVLVTAQRREQSVRDVPIAISVVTGDNIRTQGIEDVQRLAESIPSLVVSGQGQTFGGLSLSLRGIGTQTGDPAVGFYIDEVYVGNASGFVSQFLDTARVEVLKGPQGTLWGRNTTAGAIHVVTKQPTKDFSLEAFGELGIYDSLDAGDLPIRKFGVSLNTPLGEHAAVRLSYSRVEQDNYIKNLESSSTEANQDASSFRAAIRFDPTDNFDITFAADYIDDPHHNSMLFKNTAFPGSSIDYVNNLLSDVGPEKDTFRVRSDIHPEADYEEWGARITANLRLNDQWKLRSITGWRGLKLDRLADLDVTQATIVHNASQQDDKWWSQEVQAIYEGERLSLVGGVYFYGDKQTQDAQTYANTAFFLLTSCHGSNPPSAGIAGFCPVIDFVTGLMPTILGRPLKLSDFQSGGLFGTLTGINVSTTTPVTLVTRNFETKSQAAYIQGSYKVTDAVTLTAGVRYTRDSKDNVAATNGVPVALDQSFDDVTPKVAVEWRPNDASLFYASVTRGFKSGDLNLFAGGTVPGETRVVDPETVWAYEAGGKILTANRNLFLEGAVFYYDYAHYQLSVQFPEGPRVFNLDKVSVMGAEFGPVWTPAPGWRVGGAATYLKTNVEEAKRLAINPFELAAGPQSLAGHELPAAPEWKVNAYVNYSFPVGAAGKVDLGVDAQYSASWFTDVFGSLPTSGYTVFNANARFTSESGRWWTNVYVRNIGNEEYQTSNFFTDSIGLLQYYAPPRTIGIQLGFKL